MDARHRRARRSRSGVAVNAARFRDLALSLPEAAEAPHFDLASFRVRGKIFATLPPSAEVARIFVDDEHRDLAIRLHPGWCTPLSWGGKVVGVQVELRKASASFVRELLANAWRRKAPKSLVVRPRAAPAD